MGSSCIIKHFEYYSPLSDGDKELLDSLEKAPRAVRKNESVWQQGSPTEHFYTVSKGWVYAYRNMEDGTRQVLDLFVPGDIVGLREFAFRKRISGLNALTDAEICPFPKKRMVDVFSQSLLLSNIFFMIASRDQSILLERLVNLGRRSAKAKLAHFLVEISQRLAKTNVDISNHYKIPLSQGLLADALGLSAVHVNRTFHELKEEGLINPGHGGIELLDLEGLKKVAGFDPCYLDEDIDGMLGEVRSRYVAS
ncbi:MAG: Crp/Fnr family transcriptional regulator [Marinobacter sp.]|uniref:Crp/Fnr family transcriptional regulator n=1 Tax=Marinobacter sp. TaxID=50741 RepID=UPI0034A0165E